MTSLNWLCPLWIILRVGWFSWPGNNQNVQGSPHEKSMYTQIGAATDFAAHSARCLCRGQKECHVCWLAELLVTVSYKRYILLQKMKFDMRKSLGKSSLSLVFTTICQGASVVPVAVSVAPRAAHVIPVLVDGALFAGAGMVHAAANPLRQLLSTWKQWFQHKPLYLNFSNLMTQMTFVSFCLYKIINWIIVLSLVGLDKYYPDSHHHRRLHNTQTENK